MYLPIYQEASKIWKQLTAGAGNPTPPSEFDLGQQLQSFFQVGDYYYFVFNSLETCIEAKSSEMANLLGYEASRIDLPFLLSIMHPADQPYFLNFENKAREFFRSLEPEKIFNYKMRYDFRLRKADGSWMRVLQQSMAIQLDANNVVNRILVVHTDITHIKAHGAPVLSFIGLHGEPSYVNVAVEHVFPVVNDLLSRREKEILGLLIEGQKSSDIAVRLGISEATVHTHRKNMLRKGGVSNSSQLIAKAIREGWL